MQRGPCKLRPIHSRTRISFHQVVGLLDEARQPVQHRPEHATRVLQQEVRAKYGAAVRYRA
jgi:hypothetical protein